jgi:hypothetical protein
MAQNRPDILYIHHGVPRVYEIVNAIVKCGYSCRYLSGYYYRENGWPETLLRRLPARWTVRILAKMKRRYLLDLSPEIVERSWVLEALLTVELAFRHVLPSFLIVRNWYMDIRGAIRVLTLRPKAVIVCDSHALYTLRAAKRTGAIAILDQIIGHVDMANKILSEEKNCGPRSDPRSARPLNGSSGAASGKFRRPIIFSYRRNMSEIPSSRLAPIQIGSSCCHTGSTWTC